MSELLEFTKQAVTTILGLAFLALWLLGVVLAKGFWSTLAATCLPPYAIYLVAEKIALSLGIV
jgi:hypothetical protein